MQRLNAVLAVLLSSSCVALLAAPIHAQSLRYVDADAAAGGDGASWATAYRDLQDALDAARADATIVELWVAEGRYLPDRGTLDRDASFELVAGVALLGGFAGDETSAGQRDPALHVCVLDGDLADDDVATTDIFDPSLDDNSVHVVRSSGNTTTTVLDGFAIRGGVARGTTTNGGFGAGMLLEAGTVTLTNLAFSECHAGNGGGLAGVGCDDLALRGCSFESCFAVGGGALEFDAAGSDLTLESSVFQACLALHGEGGAAKITCAALRVSGGSFEDCDSYLGTAGRGGAIYVDADDVVIEDASFSRNRGSQGGAVFVETGTMSRLLFERDTFESNVASTGTFGLGSAIYLRSDSPGTVRDSRFEDNAGSGALYAHAAAATVERCTFARNHGLRGCGAFLDLGGEVRSCRFDSNHASSDAGALRSDGDGEIADCVFVDNASDGGSGAASSKLAPFVRCDFTRNVAAGNGGALSGLVDVSDCRFEANSANLGGALYANGDASIHTSTFVSNVAARDGGGIHVFSGTAAVRNSILWGNEDRDGIDESAQLFVAVGAAATLDYCCVRGLTGGFGGSGNFDADPRFVDEVGGDFHLLPDSPCIDAGEPAFAPATGRERDYDRHGRWIDGDLDRALEVDVGASEFSHIALSMPASAHPGDVITIDTLGTPGFATLMIVSAAPAVQLFPRLGFCFLDLGSICWCQPWSSAPSSEAVDVPADVPTPSVFLFQEVAIGARVGNFSNDAVLSVE